MKGKYSARKGLSIPFCYVVCLPNMFNHVSW